MPIGRKLNVDRVELKFDFIHPLLVKNGSTCEAVECASKPQPAWFYLQTEWSFILICKAHYDFVQLMPASVRLYWDKRLAEYMYEKFLERSYAHMNVKSGLLLEEAMTARIEAEKEIARLEAKQDGVERRELRKAIKASGTRIGSPDDELLVARQKQDLRVKLGHARIGPASQTPAKIRLLKSRLLIPKMNVEEEE